MRPRAKWILGTVAVAASLATAGCHQILDSADLRESHFSVHIYTSYTPRGFQGEPTAGSPCAGCNLSFSVGPATQQFTPRNGGSETQDANASTAGVADRSAGCAIPPGRDSLVLKEGDATHPGGCSYAAVLDPRGRLGFWTPKEPTTFLMVKYLEGAVAQPLEGCDRPAFHARGPETNVSRDLDLKLDFSVSCFRGD